MGKNIPNKYSNKLFLVFLKLNKTKVHEQDVIP